MKEQHCPTSSLQLLIQDELSTEESGHILTHLEECSSCQSELETLAADATWWKRTTQCLAGVAVDGRGKLPEPDESVCAFETLLEVEKSNDTSLASSKADLAILDPPIHPEMLGRIDEYDIEEKIGQGGMGIVFRGFDRSLNRPVAIKVMSPHLGAHGVARQRFAREAQAAAAVVHPNVVPIYRVSSAQQRPYIAMALVDGRSLQEHVTADGPLGVKDVVRISIQIASGLAAAHKQGLIHRDIKPANVLMEKDVSRIMITDFGLARAVDDVAMTQSGCLAGTPNYMSPEQVVGEEIDHRSDLFSLGSLMYFVATGREPFRAESAFAAINKIMRESPPPARSINAEIPEVLSRIIERLLEKNPADRIASAEALEQILTQCLAHLQDPIQHALPRVEATRTERRKLRWRIVLGLAATGLAACVVWKGFFASGHSDTSKTNSTGVHEMHDQGEHTETNGHRDQEKHGHSDDRK